MSYNVGFDTSTIYYAEKVIHWLSLPPEFHKREGFDIERLLVVYRKLKNWTEEDPDNEYYYLNKAISELIEMEEKRTGHFSFEKTPDKTNRGAHIVQFVFGMVCLARIVEAICLCDGIFYLGGAGASSMRLQSFAPWLQHIENSQSPKLRVWKSLPGVMTEKDRELYRNWYEEKKDSEFEFWEILNEISSEILSLPFLDLAGSLFDVSYGVWSNPFVFDSYGLFNTNVRSNELKSKLRMTPGNCTIQDLHVLRRIYSYLVNGICYEKICNMKKIHYVKNPVRAPFLFSLGGMQHKGDRERMLHILSQALGYKNPPIDIMWPKSSYDGEKLTKLNFVFSLVLYDAKDIYDILPAAYRLRKTLAPLREYIGRNGIDGEFEKNFEDLIERLKIRKDFEKKSIGNIGCKIIKIPLSGGNILSWLYKPFYAGKKKYLNSIRVVSDEYRNVFSISERIEKMYEISSTNLNDNKGMMEYLSIVYGD